MFLNEAMVFSREENMLVNFGKQKYFCDGKKYFMFMIMWVVYLHGLGFVLCAWLYWSQTFFYYHFEISEKFSEDKSVDCGNEQIYDLCWSFDFNRKSEVKLIRSSVSLHNTVHKISLSQNQNTCSLSLKNR